MIKQKRSKIKQATLPFVLESTHEVIPGFWVYLDMETNVCYTYDA